MPVTKPKKSKVDLRKEAAAANGDEENIEITEELLLEVCPKELLKQFKAAKTPAARVDMLYAVEHNELKKAKAEAAAIENLTKKLRQWFIQEYKDDDAQGVVGKTAKLELKPKEVAIVEDWDKFYAHIAKKKEFDLLNKAVNSKAVGERWENDKEVPGIGRFTKKSISLTKKDR